MIAASVNNIQDNSVGLAGRNAHYAPNRLLYAHRVALRCRQDHRAQLRTVIALAYQLICGQCNIRLAFAVFFEQNGSGHKRAERIQMGQTRRQYQARLRSIGGSLCDQTVARFIDTELPDEPDRLTTLIGKSTNSQAQLAYGGHAYSTNTTGFMDKLGPFAGSISTSNTYTMKIFIEDWWCSQQNFVDDFYGSGSGTYYAGQNLVPTDDTANKTAVITGLTSGYWYGNTILQGDQNFGIAGASVGSNSTGLCDGQYGSTSSATVGCVGGHSGNGLAAGPSYFYCVNLVSGYQPYIGARLAYVFDN